MRLQLVGQEPQLVGQEPDRGKNSSTVVSRGVTTDPLE